MKAKEEVKNDLNLNHNEATVSDDENEGKVQLADLPVADEQADQTRAGMSKATPKLFLACAQGQH